MDKNLLVFAVNLHNFVENVDKFTCKCKIFRVHLMKWPGYINVLIALWVYRLVIMCSNCLALCES